MIYPDNWFSFLISYFRFTGVKQGEWLGHTCISDCLHEPPATSLTSWIGLVLVYVGRLRNRRKCWLQETLKFLFFENVIDFCELFTVIDSAFELIPGRWREHWQRSQECVNICVWQCGCRSVITGVDECMGVWAFRCNYVDVWGRQIKTEK